MINHKTFVVGFNSGSANWINGPSVKSLSKATLVLFTGGQDINPSMYGKARNPMCERHSEERDAYEKEIFSEALELGLPMVGICRGAQLQCALSGGILVQHSHHPTIHPIETSCGRKLITNSCHHQRAYPYINGCEFKLLAWAPLGLSDVNEGETRNEDLTGQPEAEVVYYPKTKCLGIQGHPEWMCPARDRQQHDVMSYYRELVDRLADEDL